MLGWEKYLPSLPGRREQDKVEASGCFWPLKVQYSPAGEPDRARSKFSRLVVPVAVGHKVAFC